MGSPGDGDHHSQNGRCERCEAEHGGQGPALRFSELVGHLGAEVRCHLVHAVAQRRPQVLDVGLGGGPQVVEVGPHVVLDS